jgi:repressor LexA
MKPLTKRQRQVLEFIRRQSLEQGVAPSLREIARHFGFRSMTAAADHVRALRRKGWLVHRPRRARALSLADSLRSRRRDVVEIPLYGEIPAGYADPRVQEPSAPHLAVDASLLGLEPTAETFALRVKGDSMIGRHILDGDYVIIERGRTPKPGDVVAALIDNESTLKTFVIENGIPCLKAENPRYPTLIPATELTIQGVMVGLVRRSH